MTPNPLLALELRRWGPGRAGFMKTALPGLALAALGLLNLSWSVGRTANPAWFWGWAALQVMLILGVYVSVTLWAAVTVVTESRSQRALWEEARATPLPLSEITAGLALTLSLRLAPGLIAFGALTVWAFHSGGEEGPLTTALLLAAFAWVCLAQAAFTAISLLGSSLPRVHLWEGLGISTMNLLFDLMLIGVLVKSVALLLLIAEGSGWGPREAPPPLTPPREG